MGLRAFLADSVMLPDGPAEQAILVEDGIIMGLCPHGDIPASVEKMDYPGLTLAAGLVDIQVNGGNGVLLNDAPDVKGIAAIADAHRRYGSTTILPTLISDDLYKMEKAIEAVAAFRKQHGSWAGVAGLHLEGPFLNKERKGIHSAEKIILPQLGFLNNPALADAGAILMTIAPEQFVPDELALLHSAGVILAAGHSMADKDSLERAKQYGLRGITHLFNGMGGAQGMKAREPGLAGLALADDTLACSIIADGQHVDAAMYNIALRTKPAGQLFLVSDAMPPAAQKDKKDFMLMGQTIFARHNRCENAQGSLAGSALTLFECVKIAHRQYGTPLPKALAMASHYPARFLGLEKKIGTITKGCRADLIAFDSELSLHNVYMGGTLVT